MLKIASSESLAIVPNGSGSEDGGGDGRRKTGSTLGPASSSQSGSSTSSALRQKICNNLRQNLEGGVPGGSSDRIHSVPGADLLEQTWSHQSHLLLLLVQLFGPHQHQLPPIVIPLPLGCYVVPLQVTVREDGGPSGSVEGAMVDCGWGNTGPCLRGAFHNTTHTKCIAFFPLPRGTMSARDYMVSREEGASQLRRGGPDSSPA